MCNKPKIDHQIICYVLTPGRGFDGIFLGLQAHSYRTYMGFVCLMQISTEETDYLVDALKLRHKLHILNEVFTKPTILKVNLDYLSDRPISGHCIIFNSYYEFLRYLYLPLDLPWSILRYRMAAKGFQYLRCRNVRYVFCCEGLGVSKTQFGLSPQEILRHRCE